ncbi:MAG: glycosyltransferase family 2 protein [Rikenellaceae bacterium]
MLKPKVSIITVVYNAKEALEKTINNIRQIDYENLEYIIVDGGSTDGTKEVIEANSLWVTSWISQPDKGLYDAMNKGMRLATGAYVWFINAGDFVYSPDILKNIFAGYENYADIYYGDTVILSENGGTKGLRGKKLPKKLTLRSFKMGMVVCHQSFIVKKSIAPIYNLRYKYAADVDWVMECTRRAKTILNTRFILSKFIEGGVSSKQRNKSLKERYRIMITYFGKSRTIYYHMLIALNYFKPKYRKIKKPY